MKVLLIILLVLVLIGLIPVGAAFRYDGEVSLRLIVGPFRPQILPKKPKKPKTPKQLEKEEQKKAEAARKKQETKARQEAQSLIAKPPEPPKPKEPLPDKIRGLIPWAKLAVDLVGGVFRKLLIKKLVLHVTLAGGDPAKLAVNTARAWAVLGNVPQILGRAFRVRRSDVWVAPDFVGSKTEVEGEIQARFLVGDLVCIGVKYGLRAVKILLRKKKQDKLRAKQAALAQSNEEGDNK